jgi:hypothetical protein
MGSRRRWWWALGFSLLAIGGLVAALVVNDGAHDRARHERSLLATAERQLATTRSQLADTVSRRAAASRQRLSLQQTVATLVGQMATTGQTLTSTKGTAFLQGLDIGTLQSCLNGVKGALQQISANDNSEASNDLAAVSGACMTLDGGSNGGLVYPFDFPDPFVLRVGGTYFAYATNSAEGNIQIVQSTDLSHWTTVGNALPKLPAWAAPGGTWAPSVLQIGATFNLYYSAVVAGAGGGEECISVATAAQPQGPFVDNSAAPLVCQPGRNGSIDPNPFVGPDGALYLEWKSNGGAGQPAALWSEQLNATGTGFSPGTPTEMLVPEHAWEGGVVEAPDLVYSAGRYLLFFSGNNWDSANYGVGVATCAGPLGPCLEPSAQPILASGPYVSGPGGETIFTDASGASWIAFAAWSPDAVGYPNSRTLFLRQISLSGALPAVQAG